MKIKVIFFMFFCANFSKLLGQCTVGTVTEVANSPFATGGVSSSSIGSIAFSPIVGGNLLASVVDIAGHVYVDIVNQTTGALTPVTGSPFLTGTGWNSIAFSPVIANSLYAATAHGGNPGKIGFYSVNTATGALTTNQTITLASGTNVWDAVFSPNSSNNLFLAATDITNNVVHNYQVCLGAVPTCSCH